MEVKYKRLLLKISGEALSEGAEGIYNFDVVENICSQVKRCVQMGVGVGIVVGAGNIWRGAKQGRNMERNRADHMGMLATVINCLALQNTFENLGVESVVMTTVSMPTFAKPFNIADAKQYMSEGKVLIFGCGTGSPFFSTDTGAVLKAAELGVDAVLFAKNIDGVYTADPKVDKSARKLESITYGEILAKNLGVMDLAAAAFCQSNSLTTVVFGLNEPSSVERVVLGEALGTLVTV